MNFLNFEDWRSKHSAEMLDLTFAKPDDIFIFTRFTGNAPFGFEEKEVLFAQSSEEALGYIRHIFLYDILIDIGDDLETDFKFPFSQRQTDIISVLNYWYKLGKAPIDDIDTALKGFCKKFNAEFNRREDIEYEIAVLYGAEELRKFLVEKYSTDENFDKRRLSSFCSKELFAGKPLTDFLNDFFNNIFK